MAVPNGLNPEFGGAIKVATDTQVTTTAKDVLFFGNSNFSVSVGHGAPSHQETKGSLYLRTDGSSSSTRLYINTTGGTVWTSVTTAA